MAKKVRTAVYSSPTHAAQAVQMLERRGIHEEQISVLMSDQIGKQFKLETHSKLPEGTAIGAGTGGALGAIIAGLTAVGAIATGGAGLLVAGPIVAALAGAGAGSAAGGLVGALIGYGISEHEAKLFADRVEDGEVLVAVQCEDDDACEVVEDIFQETEGRQLAKS